MSETMEVTFLGTGTSHGVPMIGCDCHVCRSDDPHDHRNRPAAALTMPDGRTLLIDVPPEFRLEAIAARLQRVDAVLLTHPHADHILGMDDLRQYNLVIEDVIGCYGDADTIGIAENIFGYARQSYPTRDRPCLDFRVIEGPTNIAGVDVIPIPLLHGRRPILGYRIGRFAYCTDCSEIPAESWPLLEGLDLLVLDALRRRPHPTHFNLAQALEAIERIAPRRTLLTHIAHDLGHAATNAELPAGVRLAYDGLRTSVAM